MGYENINKPQIVEILKRRRAEIRKIEDEVMLNGIMTRAEIQRERSRIGRFDIRQIFNEKGNLIPISELPEDTARAIISVEIKESFTDLDTGITTQVKKITGNSKITALKDLDEYLEKRENEDNVDGELPKDATVIENAIQVPCYTEKEKGDD